MNQTATSGEPLKRREIRSFVRREGRITPAQREAIEDLWPVYGLEKSSLGKLDSVFGRRAPRILEVGCGTGDALISQAKSNPDNDYIGIEVYYPGLGTILQRIKQHKLSNVRVLRDDAMECFRETIPDRSFDKVMIFFPDPWPKKRHNKRRLIQSATLSLITAKIKHHGCLHIATDWQDYANHIISITVERQDLSNLAGETVYAPRPVWRPLTRYEKRALRLQHKVRDFVFARK